MFVPHNEDITVGQSCQSLFGGGAASRAFLGETPPGTSMANWKQGGTITFKGTVKRNQILTGISPKGGMPVANVGVEGWLVCEAEISSLPQAGVIELDLSGKLASALTAAYNKDQRFLYERVRRDIVESIRSRRLRAHDPLPSEGAIAETYGVSRMTGKLALKSLEEAGRAA